MGGRRALLVAALGLALLVLAASAQEAEAQANGHETTGDQEQAKKDLETRIEESSYGVDDAAAPPPDPSSAEDVAAADPLAESSEAPMADNVEVVEAVDKSQSDQTTGLAKKGAYVMEDGIMHSANLDVGYEHIDGRSAPSTSYSNNGQPYVITEARLKSIRDRFVYPYYDLGGDNNEGDYQKDIHSSMPQIHKNFNFQLPFFGFRFNYTRISMHGYLEFSDPPSHYTYPLVFPIKDWPAQNDPAFIGIFYSKCRIGSIRAEDINPMKPGVYFRMERDLQTRTDQMGVEMRERLTWDIREGVIGAETFNPKHSAIVTWKNMSFAGGIDNSLFKTNSFQLVLATDEVFTYAIFNYIDLQWSSHTEAGGDTTGGEGGTPAYIGFNAGNGTQSYEYLPYSQSSILRDLTGRGWGNNKPGRHIFRIDEKILVGSCNKDIDGANLPLMFAPESGNMLGGTIVNITGPCFLPTDRVICRFDTEGVQGKYVGRNIFTCVQPPLMAEGYVRFEIAVNTESYKWKGRFFVETPATATERIFFQTEAIHEKYPAEIKITWDKRNLTTNDQMPVAISLWGYKETTIRPHFTFIDILEPSVQNTGEYTINPGNYRLRDNLISNDIQFGFLQINLTKQNLDHDFDTPILWSKPIPLGWYFAPQWERVYGAKWPEKMCNIWLRSDRFLKNFAAEVPLCPCAKEQALLDKGRFLPDFDCDKDTNPSCYFNEGALHCVKTALPSGEGAGQQCCYDKNDLLMLSYDQKWGSRPQRSHNLGFIPWNEANKVPTLSHWYHDQIPYYQCCLWQDEQAVGCETYRFERRPTQDCVAYQPPGVAGVFGDPHIITFDDSHYTFNGKGEFVLLRTDVPDLKLDVQGRFEQVPPNLYGQVWATQLTSVVAAANNSATIEVRMRPRHAQWRYRLDVFANGKRVFFDRPSLKVQHFPGVVVYTPTYILNQSEVIIMFNSGAGVEVVENQGFMTTRVYLPWTYINKTRGLLGNWSWDMNDDFTKPDGTFTGVNLNDFQNIHNEFGKYWMLSDRAEEGIGAAMFTREFGKTASYYNNATFLPNFIKDPRDFLPPNRTQDINRAAELCGESYQCRYDYAMSLDRDMAHFTRNYYDSIVNIKETNSKRVISCGVLETPRFGRKTTFLFTPGTKVIFECNKNFVLVGDQRRTCLPEGRWDVPSYGYTECLRDQEYSSRQAAVTWGSILGVVIPILLLLACVWYCCFKKRKDRDEPKWSIENYSPRSRSNSRVNIKASSMGNLTDPQYSDSFKKNYSRQRSEPYMLEGEDDDDVKDPKRFEPTTPPDSGEPVKAMSTFTSAPSTKDPDQKSPDFKSLPKTRRSYDSTYRTQEPLHGHPNGEFPAKPWDLNEEEVLSSGSNDGSDITNPTLSKPAKDITYIGSQDKPRQYGRRGTRPEADSGVSTLGSSRDNPLFVGYTPGKYDDQFSTMSSTYSPPPSETYSPSTSPVQRDFSPRPPVNYATLPIPEELPSPPPPTQPKQQTFTDKMKAFSLPLKKGKSNEALRKAPPAPVVKPSKPPPPVPVTPVSPVSPGLPEAPETPTFSSRTTMV